MDEQLSVLLEREHHEIDAGVEAFLEGLSLGETRTEDLTRAVDALRRHIYLEEEFPSRHCAPPDCSRPCS